MTLEKPIQKPRPLIYKFLKTLMKDPIVILVTGDWRQGKTDTSLLMAYLALKWGLIDKIGSNIYTYSNPLVEYITTSGHLSHWLHEDKQTKLFIFDEALAHVPKRTAMSKKNVNMLKLLAEVSKGHGRMMFLSQIDKIDGDILHPAFCRAQWIKRNKKTMTMLSKHHYPYTFRNIPRSPIRFDKDRMAQFIDTKVYKTAFSGPRDEISKMAQLYIEMGSMKKVADRLGTHPETIKRAIRKALKLAQEIQASITSPEPLDENGKGETPPGENPEAPQ